MVGEICLYVIFRMKLRLRFQVSRSIKHHSLISADYILKVAYNFTDHMKEEQNSVSTTIFIFDPKYKALGFVTWKLGHVNTQTRTEYDTG